MSEENKVPTGDQESQDIKPDNNLNAEQAETQQDSLQEELNTDEPEASQEAPAAPVEEVPSTVQSTGEKEDTAVDAEPEAAEAQTEPVAETAAEQATEETESPEQEVEAAAIEEDTSAVEADATPVKATTEPVEEVPATEQSTGEKEDTAVDAEPEAAEAQTEPVAEIAAEPVTEETESPEQEVEAAAVEEDTSAVEVDAAPVEAALEEVAEPEQTEAPVEEGAEPEQTATEQPEATAKETTVAEEASAEPVAITEGAATTAEESQETAEAAPAEPVAADSDEASEETKDEDEDAEEEAEEEEEIIDYSNHTREQLADVVEELSKQDNFKRADAILNQVLPLFKAVERASRLEAKERFLADGGEEDDFEFRHDEVFNKFDASVRLLRDRKNSYYKERESRKETNYQHKLEVLDKLRDLIDGENATTNLAPIKALQEEWKTIGPVPNQHNRTLWANFNALLDRFYNNRNILFELKELDRKKNLVKKQEVCEKAETLDKLENIKDAIVQLNELHEEYKKIGPVPREVQEALWQRFKAASDAIYKKRKSYLDDLKGELMENLEKKKALAEELKPFLSFDSDRINDWNAKTKEILALQKKWDALGGLPREYAKEVNKAFWSSFKGFFGNKNNFFKKLEGMRQENLNKKEELVAKAEALKDHTDWDKTSEALKALQRQWKEIGPVPEKFRNSVYAKFKEACDAFFNNRRSSQNKAEDQYVENLRHKEDMIKEISERTEAGAGAASDLDDLMVRWGAIGFVPRNSIKSIEARFKKAIDAFVASLDVDDSAREALVMKAELNTLRKGPDADRRLNKKEFTLRKQINELEDNIALWNNNLAFFANSKTADKLKAEFDEKISKAEEEIQQLKKQLKMVRSM